MRKLFLLLVVVAVLVVVPAASAATITTSYSDTAVCVSTTTTTSDGTGATLTTTFQNKSLFVFSAETYVGPGVYTFCLSRQSYDDRASGWTATVTLDNHRLGRLNF